MYAGFMVNVCYTVPVGHKHTRMHYYVASGATFNQVATTLYVEEANCFNFFLGSTNLLNVVVVIVVVVVVVVAVFVS